jgi:hypothetical protein
MKSKTARLSLAAVLTATLLISLLPLAYAGTQDGQTQSGASSSKSRRSKNGEPGAKNTDNQDPAGEQRSAQSPEPSKAASPSESSQQQSANNNTSQSDDRSSTTSAAQDSTQPRREAPPFDRPRLELRGDPPAIHRCAPLIRERQPENGQPTPVLIHLLAGTRAVRLRRDPRPQAQPEPAETGFRRRRVAAQTRRKPNIQPGHPCFVVRRTLDHAMTEAVKVRGLQCFVDPLTANLATTVPRVRDPPARLSSKEAVSRSLAMKARS